MQTKGFLWLLAIGVLAGFPAHAQLASPSLMPYGQMPVLPDMDGTTAPPDMGSPPPAMDNAEAYTIGNIAVDVTAESAASARDKAIFDGQRKALAQLLERMDAVKGVDPSRLSDNKIAALVKNFEITGEKASSVRYIATMNVRFKPLAVQNLLSNAGVSFVAHPAMPQLILPVATSNGRPVLWEEQTAWHGALVKLDRPDALQPVIVPTGEMNDVGAIDAQAALHGEAVALGAIAHLHNAGAVIVAQISGGDIATHVPTTPLTLTVTRYDNAGEKQDSQTVPLPPATTAEERLAAAAKMVQDFLQHKLTAAAVPDSAETTQAGLQVHAPIGSLTELAQLRRRLSSIGTIQHIHLQSLRRDGADLILSYGGGPLQLQQELGQQGLLLSQAPDGQWMLRSAP